ncbi:MAG: WbqC family protein, partial [Bacteroidales bacterium]|nr:WbqC family protein [Bacteroidales bacterium]
FRNRAVVLSSQGLLNIIVPTKKTNDRKVITRDIEISYSQRWNTEAWRTIFSCYGKSPFFIYYADKVKEILFKQHKYLIDLNLEIFNFLQQTIRLTCCLTVTSQYSTDKTDNYRDIFLPKNRCKDGKDLMPYYQCFSPTSPSQKDSKTDTNNGFYTNLSSLDLLFNLGNESSDYIRNAIRQLPLTTDMKIVENDY